MCSAVCYLIQVNHVNLLARVAIVKTILLVKVHDLQRLHNASQFSCSNIRIDVQDLSCGGLGKTGEDGECAGSDGRLNHLLVHACDLAHESIPLFVQVLGSKDAARQGASTSTHPLQRLHQLQVLSHKDLTGDFKRLLVSDSDSVVVIRDNAGSFQQAVQLRTSTVEYNWVEPDTIQERDSRRQGIEFVRENGTSDLDDCKLLRLDRGEMTQVLFDLLARTNVVK